MGSKAPSLKEFVAMVLLGIIGLLSFPQMPNLQVLSIYSSPGDSLKLSNVNPGNPDDFSFTMNMVMNLSVVNSIYDNLKVDNIIMKVS